MSDFDLLQVLASSVEILEIALRDLRFRPLDRPGADRATTVPCIIL